MIAGFAARRAVYGIAIAFVVCMTVFFATRVLTDPVQLVLPFGATQAQQDALRHSLGLDRSMWSQFTSFMYQAVTFNFGDSIEQHLSARGLVLERLPATLELVGAGILVAIMLFVPLGVVAAVRPRSLAASAARMLALIGLSAPSFWVGAILIGFFAVKLGWLPAFGRGGLLHLVLPALTLAIASGGRLALVTEQAVSSELKQPYVVAAYSRGLSSYHVIVRHVLRNALLPITTIAMWEVAHNLAGSAVVVENVFAWPGVGSLLINAVENNDIFLVEAAVFIIAIIVVVTNLVTDVLYKMIDPRIEIS